MVPVPNLTRNQEHKQAEELHENRKHQLDVNPVDPCELLELIEEALEGVEYLRCRITDNIERGIKQRRDTYLESRQHDDDLKIIEHQF